MNTGLGLIAITTLVSVLGMPVWAASPVTTYASIWSDYGFKARFVYHEPYRWHRLARYHANGLASKAAQVTVTVGGSFLVPYQLSYFAGVVLGFLGNYTVAQLFTFASPLQHRELRPEAAKVKLNLGCPFLCGGYTCVDLSPRSRGVVASDVYAYLSAHGDGAVDEIFSKNLLEHLENTGEFLGLCYRELRTGGRITLVTDNAEFLPYYLPFWINHTGVGAHATNSYAESVEHGHTRHYAVFTKLHLRNLLESQGFRNVTVKRTTFGARLKAEGYRPGPR